MYRPTTITSHKQFYTGLAQATVVWALLKPDLPLAVKRILLAFNALQMLSTNNKGNCLPHCPTDAGVLKEQNRPSIAGDGLH